MGAALRPLLSRQRLAIEYDGRQHAESDRQWQRDVERREELDNDGWRIVVVLAKGIYREPDAPWSGWSAAMASGAVTSQGGDHFPTEWRAALPGRR